MKIQVADRKTSQKAGDRKKSDDWRMLKNKKGHVDSGTKDVISVSVQLNWLFGRRVSESDCKA